MLSKSEEEDLSSINSRQKGAQGERDLARRLREYGYKARRGQQYSGLAGDSDVVGVPGLHIECKRTERLQLYQAMSQAKRDAKENKIPVVMHRRNHCDWVAILEIDDFMDIYREYEASMDIEERMRKEEKERKELREKEIDEARKTLWIEDLLIPIQCLDGVPTIPMHDGVEAKHSLLVFWPQMHKWHALVDFEKADERDLGIVYSATRRDEENQFEKTVDISSIKQARAYFKEIRNELGG